jgi:hypothetical protein
MSHAAKVKIVEPAGFRKRHVEVAWAVQLEGYAVKVGVSGLVAGEGA